MRCYYIFILIISLVFLCCKQEQTPHFQEQNNFESQMTDQGEVINPEIPIDSLVSYFRQAYDHTPSEILRRYGKPLRLDSILMQNIHTGKEEDFIYKFEYPNRLIVLHYAKEVNRYFLEFVEIRDFSELAHLGFTSQITPLRLHQLLGPEQTIHQSPELGTLYQYSFKRDVEENLFFAFQRDVLTAIQYQPYLD